MLDRSFVKNQLGKFLVLREFPGWPWRAGKRPELLLPCTSGVSVQLSCVGFPLPLRGFDYKSCVGLTKVSACFASVL